MKKLILLPTLMLALISVSIDATSKKKKDKVGQGWRYEIESVGVGVPGTYLLKVWSYSANPEVAIEHAKKNAVHGVLFKGILGKPGIPSQRPLISNPNLENEKNDFFKSFFSDNGKYMKFVTLSTDGSVAAQDRLKVDREYKIGLVVSVNVRALRKDLEAAGVIKSLSSGF